MKPSRNQISESKAIQRRTGTTFHFATRFLPERVRYPTYVLYAFFRIADDVVDDEDPLPPAEQRQTLESIREAALGHTDSDDPVLAAFSDLRERHDIPDEEVDVFIDAMLSDIETARYQTHDQLSGYLRGSSVSVGQMMLEVMDPPAKETARSHAAALGEALQLTNFLRDVREDITKYDRIYLPETRLEEYGVSHADIEALRFSPAMAEVIEAELRDAEAKYEAGVQGIDYLPEGAQFAVLAAAVMYADYHRIIREQGNDVLSKRPRLSVARRLTLLARTWFAWRRTNDPVSVFHSVVDLPGTDETPETGTLGSVGPSIVRSGRTLFQSSIGRLF